MLLKERNFLVSDRDAFASSGKKLQGQLWDKTNRLKKARRCALLHLLGYVYYSMGLTRQLHCLRHIAQPSADRGHALESCCIFKASLLACCACR